MNLNEIVNYVDIVILGICLCVGYMIKNVIPSNKINKYIPTIAGILGALIAILSNIHKISPEIILTGLMSGLASTGLYEALRNLINKESEKR